VHLIRQFSQSGISSGNAIVLKIGIRGDVRNWSRERLHCSNSQRVMSEIAPKRLNLLHELIPTANTIALLVNPANATAATAQMKEMQGAVDALGLRLIVVNASNPIELEDAFATLVQQRIEALQLGVDPLFGNHVDQIVALATRSKIPTIYPWREFTAAGGLINYGASIPDAYHQVGVYAGQILKGARLADLPVQRPTKLQLVLNLRAAKALGIEFPAKLLALADEVIE
jgi:putative ABC transport system substrate-binding protein